MAGCLGRRAQPAASRGFVPARRDRQCPFFRSLLDGPFPKTRRPEDGGDRN